LIEQSDFTSAAIEQAGYDRDQSCFPAAARADQESELPQKGVEIHAAQNFDPHWTLTEILAKIAGSNCGSCRRVHESSPKDNGRFKHEYAA
jgi:hypothetical protein